MTNRMIKESLVALLVSAYATLFLKIWRAMDSVNYADGFSAVISTLSIRYVVVFVGVFIASLLFMRACRKSGARLSDFIYKWRYLIGALIVIAMVALKVSGSSIHVWTNYSGGNIDGVVLGKSRPIRSDEWSLNTPFAFAQAASGFKYVSPVIGAGMDAFIVYGQPVLDIAAIFRPFHWGYLLLGAERGLSFFWIARLVALLLVSFDLGVLILNNKRGLALMMALMISFAPFVQWWFAINGLVEMLVFGFSAVLVFNRYLQTTSYLRRAEYGAIIAWLGVSYILTFYPAWLVPISYIMLALVIWVILENRKTMSLGGKDVFVLIETILLMAAGLGYVFLKSRDTINLVMNTVFPGKRVGMDTTSIKNLFLYPSGLFSTFKGGFENSNECEVASFISFFPLGLVLFVFNSLYRRKVDILSAGLVIVSVFLGLYCFAGFPNLVLNVTLMRFSLAGRTLPILMLGQMMLLFREIAVSKESIRMRYSLSLSVIVSIMIVYAAFICLKSYYSMEMLGILFVVACAVSLAAFLIPNYPQMIKALGVCVISIALFGGLLVNPVQIGAGEGLKNPVTELVKPIVEQSPDSCWIVEKQFPYNNSIIAVGARTINSTNVYPHMDLWKKIDRDGIYEDVYNRYAHISVQLTAEETRFEIGVSPDQFNLFLNPEDLSILGVDYILSGNDLETLNTPNVQFEAVASSGSDKVYHVLYV